MLFFSKWIGHNMSEYLIAFGICFTAVTAFFIMLDRSRPNGQRKAFNWRYHNFASFSVLTQDDVIRKYAKENYPEAYGSSENTISAIIAWANENGFRFEYEWDYNTACFKLAFLKPDQAVLFKLTWL
jgi:hypothetical protein